MKRAGAIFARLFITLFVLITVAAIAAGIFWGRQTKTSPKPIAATTVPSTVPATLPEPATAPVVVRDGPGAYVEFVRHINPKIATTKPLDFPLNFSDAAHFILNTPLYVCPMRDLWVTLPNSPPLADILKSAAKEQVHATLESVEYVDWDTDDNGVRQPHVITRDTKGFHVIDASGRRDFGGLAEYHFGRAYQWNDGVVVPTDDGVSVLHLTPTVSESHEKLDDGKEPTQVLVASRGLLAWRPGGRASWFVDEKWKRLDEKSGWPDRIIHLVPMLDGSVLQILSGDGPDAVRLAWGVLEAATVDEKRIAALVDQLADPEEDKRNAAFGELQRFGPGAWPILEKLVDEQPPEGQIRLRQLLGNRATPTLGGLTLLDGRMRLAARLADGGVVFYAAAGVSVPRGNADPVMIVPAWISMRPGMSIELLPVALVHELDPVKCRLVAIRNEWIVVDDVQGPRRFMENHFEPLVRQDELAFNDPVAIDARGRWFVRHKSDPTRTLVIDPTIADPTPRLPVWALVVKGSVGWTESGWPVMKQGGAWALEENGWRPLDEKKEKMLTELPPPATRPSTMTSTTLPTTTTSPTIATSQPTEPPILIDSQGRRFYDGVSTLRVVDRDGKGITWPLPPQAVGESTARLIETKGDYFLFNRPGRVVQLATEKGDPPFTVFGIFTHGIPNTDHPTRLWLDPAGRIVLAYDGNKLAILFPGGQIPHAIELMMPGDDPP